MSTYVSSRAVASPARIYRQGLLGMLLGGGIVCTGFSMLSFGITGSQTRTLDISTEPASNETFSARGYLTEKILVTGGAAIFGLSALSIPFRLDRLYASRQ